MDCNVGKNDVRENGRQSPVKVKSNLIKSVHSFVLSILCWKLFYQICLFICSINSLLLIDQPTLFILLFYHFLTTTCSIESIQSSVLSVLCYKLFYHLCSFVCSISSLLWTVLSNLFLRPFYQFLAAIFFVKSVLFLLSSSNTLPLAASLAYYAYPISAPIFWILFCLARHLTDPDWFE